MDGDKFEVVYGSSHCKSILGILKLCEIVACLLAIILVATNGWTNNLVDVFYAATIIGIIVSLLIFVLSSTEAGHSLNGVLKYQFACHLVMFIFLLVVSAILVSRYYSNTRRAGGIFGLLGAFLYLLDAGISYKAYGIRL